MPKPSDSEIFNVAVSAVAAYFLQCYFCQCMPKDHPQCGLLIEDAAGSVFLQLRDDNPSIPFPDSWGTFGGQIEDGETPEQAIRREISEELFFDCTGAMFYERYYYDNYWIYMFRIKGDFRASDFVVEKVKEGSSYRWMRSVLRSARSITRDS